MNKVMGLNTSFLTTCESWNMNSNYQEWRNTTSNGTEKKMHSVLQEEECLSSSKKNLDEYFEKELNPIWTIM